MQALHRQEGCLSALGVPPGEYETWQARKVMAVLLEIDATADKDSTIS